MFPAEDGTGFEEIDIRHDYEPVLGATAMSTNTFSP